MVARTSPPPVADEGDGGAGRNTEQCEALQASSATMFLTDSGSASGYSAISLFQAVNLQFNIYRGVAQLVARVVWDHEAQSSKLCTPTNSERVFDAFGFFYMQKTLQKYEKNLTFL